MVPHAVAWVSLLASAAPAWAQQAGDAAGGPNEPAAAAEVPMPWEVLLEGHLGAGYDSNPTFAASPDQRRRPEKDGGEAPDPSPVAELYTQLAGSVGREWWLGGELRFRGRQYFDGSTQLWERLELEGGWQNDRWLVTLSLQGARYDRTQTNDDSWWGRSRLRAGVRVGEVLLSLHGTAGGRLYDAHDQRDVLGGGGLAALWQRGHWQLSVGADGQRRRSTFEAASRNELMPWLGMGFDYDWVRTDVQYTAYLRDFDRPERDGAEHVIRARTVFEPWDGVGLLLRFEHGRARGQKQALVYDRYDVLAGVRMSIDWAPSLPAPTQAPPVRQGPATRLEQGVRFRFHFPEASQVRIIGTFNGWQPEALQRTQDGWFEGTVAVPPGRHRYHLLVDGKPTAPPGAEHYVGDGFGGRDAVLYVPSSQSAGDGK